MAVSVYGIAPEGEAAGFVPQLVDVPVRRGEHNGFVGQVLGIGNGGFLALFGLVDEVSHLLRQLVRQGDHYGQVREGQVRADPVICDGENVYHRRLPHRLPIQGDLLGLGPVG